MRTQSSLNIAPTSGFVFRSAGCTELDDQNYGTVTEGTAGLKLQPVLPDGPYSSELPRELVPIRWRKRHYLVDSEKLVKFCNKVNDGTMDVGLSEHSSWFLLRHGDERKAVYGLPDVPPIYRRYLLAHPVSASILWVQPEPMAIPFTRHRSSRDVTVLLNVGSLDGILPGMKFLLNSDDDELVFECAEVDQVSDHTCWATFPNWDKKRSIPAKGWSLSTESRLAKKLINPRNHREL